jgi:hypothetical protein
MNAISSFIIPMPRIASMKVTNHLTIKVSWSAGIRAGRTDVIDLSPMINAFKHYRPLRENRELFASAHLIADGSIVAWGDDEIDMAADSIEALAEETFTPEDFQDFIDHYDFTHQEIAAQLGRSRRQIENYLSGQEPIPRVIALACFGLIARRDILSGPITKLTTTRLYGLETTTREVRTQIVQASDAA